MPVAVSYPGVYIKEIPSGVRTITGVATSITAFLGRTRTGPVNEPIIINSFSDFERQFGGLDAELPLTYAVRGFYLNGGSQAIIVRLYKTGNASTSGTSTFKIDDLEFVATSPGIWGNKLSATIDVEVADETRSRLGLGNEDPLFNLTVRLGDRSEKFLNLTVSENSPRRIDRVLNAESSLIRLKEWESLGEKPQVENVKPALDAWKALNLALNAEQPDQQAIDAATATYESAKEGLDNAVAGAEKELAGELAKKPPVLGNIEAARNTLKEAQAGLNGSDGGPLDDTAYLGSEANKTGLYALEKADLFNLLCIPPDTRGGDTSTPTYQTAMAYCKKRRAMLIVDAPAAWSSNKDIAAMTAKNKFSTLGLSGDDARNAALFFPRVLQFDPLRDGQIDAFAPCGIIAGVMARTDSTRGVWKAPAGLDASLNGIQGLNVNLNDAENGMLNPLGINCLRAFPVYGRVVWGARTLRGADQLADEWKYIPVRRTALFIEESLYRGTHWIVFEPNDEPLWAQIRLNIGAFMHNLFRQGAFQGTTPRDAYFVKCDKETTTQNDINLGIVNIIVGFAPLKPAEFVIIKLQQIAGQIEV
jgi:phage tail sheath protein FI